MLISEPYCAKKLTNKKDEQKHIPTDGVRNRWVIYLKHPLKNLLNDFILKYDQSAKLQLLTLKLQ